MSQKTKQLADRKANRLLNHCYKYVRHTNAGSRNRRNYWTKQAIIFNELAEKKIWPKNVAKSEEARRITGSS
jgi:hypothetical protein